MDASISTFHKICDTIAIIGNVLVLAFILQNWLILKSCKAQSYRALIMNLAAFDMMAAISDLMVQNRIIHHEDKIIFISYGPCSRCSSWTCVYFTEFLLHLYTNGVWIVFMSYGYRYYVLTRGQVRHIHLVSAVFGLYSLSFAQMFLMNHSAKVDGDVVPILLEKFPNQSFPTGPGYAYYAFDSVFNWNMLLVICHLTVPIIPLLITEFILGIRVYHRLIRDKEYLSESTQELHWQLLKALICQTSLPIIWLLGIISCFLGRFDVLPASIAEYSASSFFIIIPVLGPMFNIYFIKSFRYKIINWFSRLKKLFKKKSDKVSSYPTVSAFTSSSEPVIGTTSSTVVLSEIK